MRRAFILRSRVMRNAIWAMVLVGAAAACKGGDKAPASGCTTDKDCKGDRICAKGECVSPAPGSAPASGSAAAGGAPATGSGAAGGAPAPDPVAAPAVDGPSCASVVAHLGEIAAASAEGAPYDAADALAKCTAQVASPAHLACLTGATTVAEVSDCDKAVFAGAAIDTAITREFDGLHLDPADKPGSEDGDYLVFRNTDGRKCGFLARELHFANAMFVMCGGEIISSALTTRADIEAVSAQFADRQRQEADLVRGIMANWPSGRETRVYNASGVYVGTHY